MPDVCFYIVAALRGSTIAVRKKGLKVHFSKITNVIGYSL